MLLIHIYVPEKCTYISNLNYKTNCYYNLC